MLLLLDTATGTCKVTFIEDDDRFAYIWQADRTLADGLLTYIEARLNECGKSWNDVHGIGVHKGPGSFTGLRIGITIVNTIAQTLNLPIIGVSGDDWEAEAVRRLNERENDTLVMPEYGAEAHITRPRK